MADDRKMLDDLLEDDRLGEEERSAFEDMLAGLGPRGLSQKQLAWVQDRWERLDLGVGPSLNLHSSGKVPDGNSNIKLPWELPGYVKPLRPPGRK